MPPRISVFPKCYFDDLCAGRMDYLQWLRDARALGRRGHRALRRLPRAARARCGQARAGRARRDGAGLVAAVLLARLHASGRRRAQAAGAAAEGRDRHVGRAGVEALPDAQRAASAWHEPGRRCAAHRRWHPGVARVRRGARRRAVHGEPLQGRQLDVPRVRAGRGRVPRDPRADRSPEFRCAVRPVQCPRRRIRPPCVPGQGRSTASSACMPPIGTSRRVRRWTT